MHKCRNMMVLGKCFGLFDDNTILSHGVSAVAAE
jgi:hypothetical protein